VNWKESLAWLESLGRFGSRPGLDRINRVLDELGRPQQGLNIIHVGGTNGKGSVSAFISSVLTAAGYRTGLYTSPHLSHYSERFQIDDAVANDDELARYFTKVRAAVERLHDQDGLILTEFEVLTVVAFLYFAAQEVDYLVLEVGMGGRLDATNVAWPKLAVITRIGLDHMAVLGNTLAAVAGEKAGIIKPKVPVVMGKQEPECVFAIRDAAQHNQAPLCSAEDLVAVQPKEHTLNGQLFDLKVAGRLFRDVRITLLGLHQLENVATAVSALEMLNSQGANISDDALRRGLAAASWPARFEVVRNRPLVIIDGAHNADGAKALARTVRQYLPGLQPILVVGLLSDKDVSTILSFFASFAARAIVTRPDSPRAAQPHEVATTLKCLGVQAEIEPDIGAAVAKALALTGPDDAVLVCGSLYLAGTARGYLLSGSF
jgi:dihydrofolate synthase/folylpolyglutamate synthase